MSVTRPKVRELFFACGFPAAYDWRDRKLREMCSLLVRQYDPAEVPAEHRETFDALLHVEQSGVYLVWEDQKHGGFQPHNKKGKS